VQRARRFGLVGAKKSEVAEENGVLKRQEANHFEKTRRRRAWPFGSRQGTLRKGEA